MSKNIKRIAMLICIIGLVSGPAFAGGEPEQPPPPAPTGPGINSAELEGSKLIYVRWRNLPEDISSFDIQLTPDMGIVEIRRESFKMWITTEKMFQAGQEYSISFTDTEWGASGEREINLGDLQELIFNDMYSEKPLGYNLENGQSTFRLFAPGPMW
jgi:hypothetical protein